MRLLSRLRRPVPAIHVHAYPARRGAGWTDQEMLSAIRVWHSVYGQPPRWVDWTLSRLRAKGIEPKPGVAEGRWPTARQVTGRFACSWNDAIRRAGLEPRPAHRPVAS